MKKFGLILMLALSVGLSTYSMAADENTGRWVYFTDFNRFWCIAEGQAC